MSTAYERLLQNLNIIKWELKNHNDSSLNLCIKYVNDAIVEAGRLNHELENANFVLNSMRRSVDLDVYDGSD